MKKKTDFRIYELNDKNDYSLDFLKTLQGSFEVGTELDILDNIMEFIKKYHSKYTDEIEAKQYLGQLEKNGYIELSKYKNGRQNAILKQKGFDYINGCKSIYEK